MKQTECECGGRIDPLSSLGLCDNCIVEAASYNGDRLVIIHNQIHELLVEMSEKQGWNKESQIMHLCGFVQRTVDDPEWTSNSDVHLRQFREYLQAVANEENQAMSQ